MVAALGRRRAFRSVRLASCFPSRSSGLFELTPDSTQRATALSRASRAHLPIWSGHGHKGAEIQHRAETLAAHGSGCEPWKV